MTRPKVGVECKMTNKTPKTDAALIDNADLSEWGCGKSNHVDADFARQLEEENNNMFNTLCEVHGLITNIDHSVSCSIHYDQACDCGKNEALTKLQPFLQ